MRVWQCVIFRNTPGTGLNGNKFSGNFNDTTSEERVPTERIGKIRLLFQTTAEAYDLICCSLPRERGKTTFQQLISSYLTASWVGLRAGEPPSMGSMECLLSRSGLCFHFDLDRLYGRRKPFNNISAFTLKTFDLDVIEFHLNNELSFHLITIA